MDVLKSTAMEDGKNREAEEGRGNTDQWVLSYSYIGAKSSDTLLQSRVIIDNSNVLYISKK
jgi:hypothetical protein